MTDFPLLAIIVGFMAIWWGAPIVYRKVHRRLWVLDHVRGQMYVNTELRKQYYIDPANGMVHCINRLAREANGGLDDDANNPFNRGMKKAILNAVHTFEPPLISINKAAFLPEDEL